MLTVLTLSLALVAGGAPAVAPPIQTCTTDSYAPAAVPASIGDIGALAVCTAIADCGSDPDVSCFETTSPATCKAVDRNCSTTRGYVECDGIRTYCSSLCPITQCTDGATRTVHTGLCCSPKACGGESVRYELCDEGTWQVQSFECVPNDVCPAYPC